MIPLNKLIQPKEVYKAVSGVITSGRYVKGPLVEELEEKWADRCGMKYAVATGSGAQALELAIESIWEVKREMIVTYPSWTFRAVWNALDRLGNGSSINDEKPDIWAHHLHDMKPDYIPLLEDCSHCHGYKPIAETAIFSFFPAKILGACGESGIVVTNNKKISDHCKHIRNHGEPAGTNARMDEIQAAVLLAKLPYLDEYIEKRQKIVTYYDNYFGRYTPGKYHYAYCIPGSEEKLKYLLDKGVESAFYYTEKYMAIPLHPFLNRKEMREVASCVKTLL